MRNCRRVFHVLVACAATATLNAADEIAVEAFLDRRIPFLGIAATVAETLEQVSLTQPASVADVLEVDRNSRRVAREIIAARWGANLQTGATVEA